MKYGKMMMGAMSLAAIAAATESALMDNTPKPRMDTSKPATLSRNEWKRRKRKRLISKHSRKQNRL